ncbi:mucin-associated surface protein (MASP) [Trypanosoma cruzi Dm28c]|uniref:Mucin-associated surface protein (MASP) n=2 Tax=Trypanosoma cruzi TaxID=5693 RepID=V5AJY7_TRYCR|nr:mucin-associated surface protein (MASP) [Trypanosoma cruzi Dm28c]
MLMTAVLMQTLLLLFHAADACVLLILLSFSLPRLCADVMMMMTGRVLLVCALCVLWCGVCCGGRVEATPASPASPPSSDKDPKTEKETTGVTGQGDQSGKQTAPQVPAPKASVSQEVPANSLQAQQPGGGASVTPITTKDSKDQNAQDKNEEDEEEKDEEEELEEEEEEEKIEQENEEREESRGEEKRDGKKEEEVKKHEDAATGTTNEIPAGSQKQPSLPSGTEGASNITHPNSTQTTGDDDPVADAAGTREEKQNENKDANPKETPVTATAMKNTTATTGDSDGSTAISHTTSPLLLLVFVACAAAAAVVAA